MKQLPLVALLLVVNFQFISCGKESTFLSGLLEFPIPSQTQSGDDCSIQENKICSGVAVNICVDCDICRTDERLESFDRINVILESYPSRVGKYINTLILDSNYSGMATLCLPRIEGLSSHVIGFSLSDTVAFGSEYVAFTNINLSQNELDFNYTITSKDFWDKSPCTSNPPIVFSEDPTNVDFTELEIDMCIVGSIGDCFEGLYSSISPEEIEFNALDIFNDTYKTWPSSTPCSGIYITIP